jgi:hypothetical protein
MLILDALFILALVSVLNQGEEPEFFKAFLVGLGLAVAGFVAVLGLTANFGPGAAFLALPLLALAAGAALLLVFEVPPIKALIGGAVYLVYKIALQVIFAMMFAAVR